jgi:hypothetical protein
MELPLDHFPCRVNAISTHSGRRCGTSTIRIGFPLAGLSRSIFIELCYYVLTSLWTTLPRSGFCWCTHLTWLWWVWRVSLSYTFALNAEIISGNDGVIQPHGLRILVMVSTTFVQDQMHGFCRWPFTLGTCDADCRQMGPCRRLATRRRPNLCEPSSKCQGLKMGQNENTEAYWNERGETVHRFIRSIQSSQHTC